MNIGAQRVIGGPRTAGVWRVVFDERHPGEMSVGSADRPDRPRPVAQAALHDEEAALLEQVAAGDRGAPLVELYRRYEGRLGVPLGTVKSRTFHALRALKAALAERGVYG